MMSLNAVFILFEICFVIVLICVVIQLLLIFLISMFIVVDICASLFFYYRPPEGGRLYDMKVVSGYAFLRTYYV